MTLPRCLDIFRPCSSTTSPRHTTFSYDDRPKTSVPTAISRRTGPGSRRWPRGGLRRYPVSNDGRPQRRRPLGEQHRPSRPDVDDLGNARGGEPALRHGNDVVHAGRCGSSPDRSRPARPASSASDPTQVTWPNGTPRQAAAAPVPCPRQRPVHVVAQPLAVPAVLDRRRLQLVFSFSASSWSSPASS